MSACTNCAGWYVSIRFADALSLRFKEHHGSNDFSVLKICKLVYLFPGNRPHPASIDPEFKADDPRLKYVVKNFDPRIHFALVCGAKVRIYCQGLDTFSLPVF